jgi:hypothetical protein
MTIRNRRRNRWRRKLRRCNQCRHFWWDAGRGDRATPDFPEWGCKQEDTSELDRLSNWTLKLEEQVERATSKPCSIRWEDWWKLVAPKCPHYQAYDRSANQLAQSTQRISILEVKHYG